ncbi:MAG TPA: efflux RND transporter periplasmic adaptor subunit, partial [Bryobacteraceae bacterium]|nr:efflux RND transporter periplasmic adaptor subunit [Bryobacteraceae bacterium]
MPQLHMTGQEISNVTTDLKSLESVPLTKPVPPEAIAVVPPKRRFRRIRRLVWWIAGCLIAAAIAVILLNRGGPKSSYTFAVVDRGTIESTVMTSGNLNAVITVQVGSQVSGNIIALHADFNTQVKKGQLVAEIDPAPFQAAVDQASAALAAANSAVATAEATLSKSQSDLAAAAAQVASQQANLVKAQSAADFAKIANDRRQMMVRNGSTSVEDADTSKAAYDQALASVDAAKAAVAAAEASHKSAQDQVSVTRRQLEQTKALVRQDEAVLAQARLNLSHTKILAPVDGTVESRNMDVGQTVAASFQAPTIFLIAQDLTKMQVDTNVDEADIGRIRVGQKATFTVDAWPGRVFHGVVQQIRQAPINVQNVITYDVVVQVSNEDLALFPGMTANVTISVARAEGALRLPKAALRYRPPAETKPGGAPRNGRQTVYVRGA